MLNLLAYFVIPIYTIWFVGDTDWFALNLSVLSSQAERRNAFFIWGILVEVFFYLALKKIIFLLPRKKAAMTVMNTACILLALGITTPYLPERLPFQSFLHVAFAFSASLLLLVCLYQITLSLYKRNRPYYETYLVALVFITTISGLLLLAAGIVSSALEIFFTISSCIFVRKLHKKALTEHQRRE